MTIEKRLENLERELARAKCRGRWLLGVMLLVVGLFAIGFFETTAIKLRAQDAGKEREIRANKFILEDEMGKVRAMLSVVDIFGIGPLLALYDNGNVRAMLGMLKDGPALLLFDEKGKPRVELGIGEDGPGLGLYDENGKSAASLEVLEDGPMLDLFDKNGKVRTRLAIVGDYTNLSLWDKDGKVIWSAIK